MDKDEVVPWKCKNKECGATLGLIRRSGRGYHQLLMYRVAISAEHEGEPPDVAAVLVGLVLDVRCSICENVQPWIPDREALLEMLERIDARRDKSLNHEVHEEHEVSAEGEKHAN